MLDYVTTLPNDGAERVLLDVPQVVPQVQPSAMDTEDDATPRVSAEIERFRRCGVLKHLLRDFTTKRNIIWASSVFEDKGASYAPQDEILVTDVTGLNSGLIRTRAEKAEHERAALTKAHAEVFTPTWVVKMMVDVADEAWWEAHPEATWQDYVMSPRLEITCGEAPYLVMRYDAADGSEIPVAEREGILDRKLRVVSEHTNTRTGWMRYAHMALKSTYGYEFQGDNLLIARVNVLADVEEHAREAGYGELPRETRRSMAITVSRNLWQMNGLSDLVPRVRVGASIRGEQGVLDLDATLPEGESLLAEGASDGRHARIYDWMRSKETEFFAIKQGGVDVMRFDYVIGNPPYQDENGENGRQPPLYHLFIDASYAVADVVELITPARFLFNAGQTPKAWNRKMLSDKHVKVVYYSSNGADVFPNTDIKGGVVITYRDVNADFGAIGFFASTVEMNPIIHKVSSMEGDKPRLDSVVSSQGLYKFADSFFDENPSAMSLRGSGTGNKIVSRFVESYPEGFVDNPPENSEIDYVGLLCRFSNGRACKYVQRKHVQANQYLDTYNVLVPKANGSGKFGEKLSGPEVSSPGNGSADTFISIGMLNSESEADALLKYMQSKFLRAMLGAKKVTQDNPKAVWSLIPIQDFTDSSDIDWSQSISDIDQQLYKKYGLSQEEIDFIESHVKEMV